MGKIMTIILSVIFIFITNQYVFTQPTQWFTSDVGGGGAVYAPSINPLNPSEVYLSCDMGLMFHSTDSAFTWNTIHFNSLSGNRFSEVQFTNNNNIRYVLSNSPVSGKYNPAISTNGGSNWNIINPSAIGTQGAFRMFAHQNFSNIIVVSGYDKIFFSNSSGSTYTTVHTASPFLHLAGVFFSSTNIYICTNKGFLVLDLNGNIVQPYTLHSSIGIANTSEDVVSFSGALQGSIIRFIGVSIISTSFSPRTYADDTKFFQGIYKMDYNSSVMWNDLTANFKSCAPSNKAYNIAMAPDNANTFYVGGTAKVPDNTNGFTLGTVFKSSDGGNSFSNVFLNSTFTTNANVKTGWQGSKSGALWTGHPWTLINTTEGITVSRNNINYLIRSDKSNVYISIDGGNTWQQRYVSQGQHNLNTLITQSDLYKDNGLQTTACYYVTWIDPNNMYVSFADLLAIRSTNAGANWSFNYTGLDTVRVGDASMVIKHPDGKLYAATGDVPGSNGDYSDLRVSMAFKGRISISSDNGLTWQTFKSFSRPVLSIDFNPLNMQEMYVTVSSENGGIGNIYRFTDKNNPASMTTIPAPPGTQNRPGHLKVLNDGTLMCYYTCRDIGTSGPVYVYAPSSGVFYTSNSGVNWSGNNLTGMTYDVRSVTIDRNDNSQNTWWACIGKNGSGGVPGLYKTTNRGNSWTLIINNKNTISCTFHPLLANVMYLSTQDEGLFYCTNTNNVPALTLVSSYPFKFPQEVFFNPYNVDEVWVTSFGNGLKKGYTNLVSGIHYQNTKFNNELIVFPNPANDLVNIKRENQTVLNVKIYSTLGKLVKEYNSALFSVSDLTRGIYFVVIRTNKDIFKNKLIIR